MYKPKRWITAMMIVVVAAVCGLHTNATAEYKILAQIDGIDGEFEGLDYPAGWIEAVQFSSDIVRDIASGQVCVGDFVLVKRLDKASPVIGYETVYRLGPNGNATIHFVDVSATEPKLRTRIILTGVQIAGVTVSGDSEQTAMTLPLETVKLAVIDNVRIIYTRFNQDGSVAETIDETIEISGNQNVNYCQ